MDVCGKVKWRCKRYEAKQSCKIQNGTEIPFLHPLLWCTQHTICGVHGNESVCYCMRLWVLSIQSDFTAQCDVDVIKNDAINSLHQFRTFWMHKSWAEIRLHWIKNNYSWNSMLVVEGYWSAKVQWILFSPLFYVRMMTMIQNRVVFVSICVHSKV